jgi:hypothetical protein
VVDVDDELGNVLTTRSDTITLSIASGPAGAILHGFVQLPAVRGVATFSDVRLNTPGDYTLAAMHGVYVPATSAGFTMQTAS